MSSSLEITLLAFSVIALMGSLTAFVVCLRRRFDLTEVGWALLVGLLVMIIFSFAGVSRRTGFEYQGQMSLIAYACTIGFSIWLIGTIRQDNS